MTITKHLSLLNKYCIIAGSSTGKVRGDYTFTESYKLQSKNTINFGKNKAKLRSTVKNGHNVR